jgi:polyisoprenoid-binding protein YceI
MMLHRRCTVALLFACAAIAATATHGASVPATFPAQLYANAPPATVFRVDPQRSWLQLRIYRAGALSKLGHNHIITGALAGAIAVPADATARTADLYVEVAALVVDAPAARAAAGEGFTSTPSEGDIERTRKNMLGDKVLDAAAHPFITAHITQLVAGDETSDVRLALTIRDHTAVMTVPVVRHGNGDELSIQAHFTTDHATLGLKPFSALFGALAVAERIDVEISLVALRGQIKSAGSAPDR